MLASRQMIVNDLKRVAGEMLDNVVRSLLRRKMYSVAVFTKRFFMQREESGVALDTQPARIALAQVIGHRQQFRGGQLTEGITLNLFLSQVFHLIFVWSLAGNPAGFTCISWRKMLRITIGSK